MIEVPLIEFKNEGVFECLEDALEEINTLYTSIFMNDVIAKSTFMVLDFTKLEDKEYVNPGTIIGWLEEINEGNKWNDYIATDYLEAFLRDIDYENRTELHEKRIAFISKIEVCESERGKGKGKKMMEQLLERCEEKGVEIVFLQPSPFGLKQPNEESKINETNRLYRFYEKAGLEEYEHGGTHRLIPERNAYMKVALPRTVEKKEENQLPTPIKSVTPPNLSLKAPFTISKSVELSEDELPF